MLKYFIFIFFNKYKYKMSKHKLKTSKIGPNERLI